MVRLRVLSGLRSGFSADFRLFPFTVGRASGSALVLEDPGVWDQHLRLEVVPGEGVLAQVIPPAVAAIGGQPLARQILRNGDVIEFGAVRLRFELTEPGQRSLVLREILTWLAVAGLCALQLAIIHWLVG